LALLIYKLRLKEMLMWSESLQSMVIEDWEFGLPHHGCQKLAQQCLFRCVGILNLKWMEKLFVIWSYYDWQEQQAHGGERPFEEDFRLFWKFVGCLFFWLCVVFILCCF
jgi:hypothetical protein